jgi:hypothetical protein
MDNSGNAIGQPVQYGVAAMSSQRGAAQVQTKAIRNKIIADYGAFLEEHAKLKGAYVDVKSLPHPKEEILNALLVESVFEPNEKVVEQLRSRVVFLVDFHEGVGPKPLHYLGVDISNVSVADVKTAVNDPRMIEVVHEIAAGPNAERAARFRELAAADLTRIWAKIEMAKVIRVALREAI